MTEGLPAELDVTRFQIRSESVKLALHTLHLRALGAQLVEAQKQLDHTLLNADQTDYDEASQFFIEDVIQHKTDTPRLTNEILKCDEVKLKFTLKPILNSSKLEAVPNSFTY